MAVRLLGSPVAKDLIYCGHVFKTLRWETHCVKSSEAFCDIRSLLPSIRTMSTTGKKNQQSKCVTIDNMNENIIRLEYAVRGPLVIRAGEIEKELEQVRDDNHNFPGGILSGLWCGELFMPGAPGS